MSERKLYYKPAFLYTPDFAQKHGFPAEGPVFLGNRDDGSYYAYQAGQVAEGRHYILERLPELVGWAAQVEPLDGINFEDGPLRMAYSEAVKVHKIFAFHFDFRKMTGDATRPLTSGKIVSLQGGESCFPVEPGMLPGKSDLPALDTEINFHFEIRPYGVVFRNGGEQPDESEIDVPRPSRRRRRQNLD